MADTYTIQFRRGMYADFDTSKIRPGEPVAILGNDPSVPSGKALYIAFAANDVRRLCSIEDISEMVNAGEFAGPQGPKGEKGERGEKGDKGDVGPKGDNMSDEQAAQIEQNKKDVASLKEDLNDLKEQGIGGGSGIKGLADLCLALKGARYDTLEASQAARRFVEANEGGAPTLTSITVTWSADSADVGTDPKTLISLVKANYSDGTSQTVTSYTVSPSALVEGSQTVTVSYDGKTATKTIVGNAKQAVTVTMDDALTLYIKPDVDNDGVEDSGDAHTLWQSKEPVSADCTLRFTCTNTSGSTFFGRPKYYGGSNGRTNQRGVCHLSTLSKETTDFKGAVNAGVSFSVDFSIKSGEYVAIIWTENRANRQNFCTVEVV